MTIIATGEIDLKLSPSSLSKIENDLTAGSKRIGGNAGKLAGTEFGTKFGGGVESKLAPALSKVEGGLKGLVSSGNLGGQSLGLLGKSADSLKDALGKIGPAGAVAGVAVAGIAGLAEQGIEKFVDLAGQIYKFNTISGAGAEASSRFVVALDELGIDSDAVGKGLFKLSRSTIDGKNALSQYNVEIARTKTGNFDAIGTFLNIADAIHGSSDAAERNAIAFTAFGRAGLLLLPILAQGRDQLAEFLTIADKRKEVFTQKDINDARQFQIATRGLGESFDALEISIGRRAVPFITNFLSGTAAGFDFLTSAVDAGEKHLGFFGKVLSNSVVQGLANIVPPLGTGIHAIEAIGESSNKSAAKLGALGAAQVDLAKTTKDSIDSITSAGQDVQAFGNLNAQALVIQGVATGKFSASAAGLAGILNTDVKTGLTDYNKALAALDPISARVAQDNQNIALGVDVAAAKFDLGAAAADRFAGGLKLTLDPFEAVVSANIKYSESEDSLQKLLVSGTATRTDLSKATLDVVQSVEAQIDANLRDKNGTLSAIDAKKNLLETLRQEQGKHPALAAEIGTYIDRVNQIPPEKLTEISENGADGAGAQVNALKDILAELKSTYHFLVTGKTDDAESEVDRLKAKLLTIDGRTFSFSIRNATPNAFTVGGSPIQFKASAAGGDIGPGWNLVGEKGPELLRLDRGQSGHVFTNEESARMLSQQPSTTTNHFTVIDNTGDPRATAESVAVRLGQASQR